jgi:hypothetical protein
MSRRLGLIIGINQYQDPTFRTLQFAESDTRALAQWLVNEKGGKWSPGSVQLVQGPHATRELVESLVSQLCHQMVEPGDTVLIYFAGHAFVDERSGDGYLSLSNTHYQDTSTAIHLLSLLEQMIQSRATHTLLILDCFQTGPRWSTSRTSPYDVRPLLGPALAHTLQQHSNRFLLCSCRGNERAPEAGERGLGIFLHRMIVGLCGPALDPALGVVTLQYLHSYLYNVLGEQQRPHLFGRVQAPLALVGDIPSPDLDPSSPSGTLPFSPGFPHSTGTLPFSPGMQSSSQRATATAQLPPQPQDPSSTGQQRNPMIEQHRQQQISQLLASARQLLQAQKYPEAMTLVERVLQIAPDDIAALILKAQLLGTVGQTQEALAITERLTQLDANNALVWSMRAVLLNNTGQYQAALAAIEHSLELNPNDPETYAIKTNIMAGMAELQSQEQSQQHIPPPFVQEKRGGPLSFFVGTLLQVAGLIMGIGGMAMLILQPALPVIPGFVAASLGIALLCVNAARGAYRYGFLRLLMTFFFSLVTAGILAAAYRFGYTRMLTIVENNPALVVPILFCVAWLVAATLLPLLLAFLGWIGGFITGVRRKKT